MKISIFVEPSPAGFRAMTGAPLDLAVEAPSASEAMASLEAQIAHRLHRGGVFVEHHVPDPIPMPPLPSLAENPLFDDWLAAVREYQEEKEKEDREYYMSESR